MATKMIKGDKTKHSIYSLSIVFDQYVKIEEPWSLQA